MALHTVGHKRNAPYMSFFLAALNQEHALSSRITEHLCLLAAPANTIDQPAEQFKARKQIQIWSHYL